MSEGIGIDIPSPSDFVGANPTSREKVVHMLARTLQIRHRVGNRHQRWEFTLPHIHPHSC